MDEPKQKKTQIKSLNFSNLKEPAFNFSTLFLLALFFVSFLKIILGCINDDFFFRLKIGSPDPGTFLLFIALTIGGFIKLLIRFMFYFSKTKKELEPNSTFLRLCMSNEDAKKVLTYITENNIEFHWE